MGCVRLTVVLLRAQRRELMVVAGKSTRRIGVAIPRALVVGRWSGDRPIDRPRIEVFRLKVTGEPRRKR